MKLSLNGVSTIFGVAYLVYQGFTQINELITKQLNTFIAKNTMHNRKHTDSKLIDITSRTACKHILLVVENAVLIRYYLHTANTSA
jgi:hypothetical protein